jgi:hypothetical protein
MNIPEDYGYDSNKADVVYPFRKYPIVPQRLSIEEEIVSEWEQIINNEQINGGKILIFGSNHAKTWNKDFTFYIDLGFIIDADFEDNKTVYATVCTTYFNEKNNKGLYGKSFFAKLGKIPTHDIRFMKKFKNNPIGYFLSIKDDFKTINTFFLLLYDCIMDVPCIFEYENENNEYVLRTPFGTAKIDKNFEKDYIVIDVFDFGCELSYNSFQVDIKKDRLEILKNANLDTICDYLAEWFEKIFFIEQSDNAKQDSLYGIDEKIEYIEWTTDEDYLYYED